MQPAGYWQSRFTGCKGTNHPFFQWHPPSDPIWVQIAETSLRVAPANLLSRCSRQAISFGCIEYARRMREDVIGHSTLAAGEKPEWLLRRLEWFRELQFGIILHWGIYAFW